MSGYDEMITKDLEFLRSIQDYFHRTPWLDSVLSRIVSKYPLQDIGIIVWCFFVIGVVEIGRQHLWIVAFNLVFAVGKFLCSRYAILSFVLQQYDLEQTEQKRTLQNRTSQNKTEQIFNAVWRINQCL